VRILFGSLSKNLSTVIRMKYVLLAFAIASLFACSKKIQVDNREVMRGIASVQNGPLGPANGKIAYIADFWDDMVRMYLTDRRTGKLATKLTAAEAAVADYYYPTPTVDDGKFDDYFKKFYNQGISRLVVYGSPLSFVLNNEELYCGRPAFDFPANVPHITCERWQLFKRLNAAILNSHELDDATAGSLRTYAGVRQLLHYRFLTGDYKLSKEITEAAARHDVALAFEFRPFEQSARKYYPIPVYNSGGAFHYYHSPFATPEAEWLKHEVGFPHYRKALELAGKGRFGQIGAIRFLLSRESNTELKGIYDTLLAGNPAQGEQLFYEAVKAKFSITAAMHAPVHPDAFVLKQKGSNDFELVKYSSFGGKVEAQQYPVTGYTLSYNHANGTLLLRNVNVPSEYSHLLFKSKEESGAGIGVRNWRGSVELWSQEGTLLGHNGSYWVYKNLALDPQRKTLVAAITSTGDYHSEFLANAASEAISRVQAQHRLSSDTQIVVNRGEEFTDDMNDFSRPAALLMARRQIDLAFRSGFRDLMFNVRSHMQFYDDAHYAYAPRSIVENPIFVELASDIRSVQQITVIQERVASRATTCQSDSCTYRWRLARNQEVGHQFEKLMKEISDLYPDRRMQAILPESEGATAAIQSNVPGGFNAHIDSGWNYSWIRLEGQAMASLNGTHVEPVLMGLRSVPPEGLTEAEILPPFLNAVIPDLAVKRSDFTGPTSVLFEAQNTLNAAGDPKRALAICALLTHSSRINEVMLYESGDYYAWRSTPGEYHYLANCRQTWGAALGQ